MPLELLPIVDNLIVEAFRHVVLKKARAVSERTESAGSRVPYACPPFKDGRLQT